MLKTVAWIGLAVGAGYLLYQPEVRRQAWLAAREVDGAYRKANAYVNRVVSEAICRWASSVM